MKKILSAVITVLMILSLTACGGEKEIEGEITQNKDSSESQSGEVNSFEDEDSNEEELADKPLSFGRMDGGTYKNTYIGVACDLDSSWSFYSAEELQEMPGNIEEILEGTELMDGKDGLDTIIDMQAENVEQMVTMNINYRKLSMQDRIAFAMVDEEEIVNQMLGEKEMMEEAYAQMGLTDMEMSAVKVNFLGEEHTALKTYGKIQDVDYYILQIMNYELGQYGVTYTFSSYLEDNTQGMLDLFYVLE